LDSRCSGSATVSVVRLSWKLYVSGNTRLAGQRGAGERPYGCPFAL
jgi:hypothetical protein